MAGVLPPVLVPSVLNAELPGPALSPEAGSPAHHEMESLISAASGIVSSGLDMASGRDGRWRRRYSPLHIRMPDASCTRSARLTAAAKLRGGRRFWGIGTHASASQLKRYESALGQMQQALAKSGGPFLLGAQVTIVPPPPPLYFSRKEKLVPTCSAIAVSRGSALSPSHATLGVSKHSYKPPPFSHLSSWQADLVLMPFIERFDIIGRNFHGVDATEICGGAISSWLVSIAVGADILHPGVCKPCVTSRLFWSAGGYAGEALVPACCGGTTGATARIQAA